MGRGIGRSVFHGRALTGGHVLEDPGQAAREMGVEPVAEDAIARRDVRRVPLDEKVERPSGVEQAGDIFVGQPEVAVAALALLVSERIFGSRAPTIAVYSTTAWS